MQIFWTLRVLVRYGSPRLDGMDTMLIYCEKTENLVSMDEPGRGGAETQCCWLICRLLLLVASI